MEEWCFQINDAFTVEYRILGLSDEVLYFFIFILFYFNYYLFNYFFREIIHLQWVVG